MTPAYIHLSFYRFVRLHDLPALRLRVRAEAERLQLKGTVLLAEEGVNAMVSGDRAAIDQFRAYVRTEFGMPEFQFKEGPAHDHAFNRLLIKIKREIIPVGDPDIQPEHQTAERLDAATLKQWLDEGRPLRLLDTRNVYEIEVGTFRGAEHFGLETSRAFADSAQRLLPHDDERPIVTFCTGGIRCEKASAVLLKQGHRKVYQLNGGILKYLEENGSAHYDGSCFVFDWRLAVDGSLQPVPRSKNADAEFGRHLR